MDCWHRTTCHSNSIDRFVSFFCCCVYAVEPRGNVHLHCLRTQPISIAINKPKTVYYCRLAPFLMGQLQFCIAIRHFHFIYGYGIPHFIRLHSNYLHWMFGFLFFSYIRCNLFWFTFRVYRSTWLSVELPATKWFLRLKAKISFKWFFRFPASTLLRSGCV